MRRIVQVCLLVVVAVLGLAVPAGAADVDETQRLLKRYGASRGEPTDCRIHMGVVRDEPAPSRRVHVTGWAKCERAWDHFHVNVGLYYLDRQGKLDRSARDTASFGFKDDPVGKRNLIDTRLICHQRHHADPANVRIGIRMFGAVWQNFRKTETLHVGYITHRMTVRC